MNDLLHVKQNRSTKSTPGPLREVSLYTVSVQLTIAGHEGEVGYEGEGGEEEGDECGGEGGVF